MNYKALVLCACALCTAASCVTYKQSPDSPTFTANAADSSSDISFTAIGQYTQVTISNTTETPVWYSDNSNVATVDSSGIITAVGEGSCTIYAVFSSQMLSFNVTTTLPEEETDFVVGSVELSNDLPVVQLSLGSLDLTNAVWSSSDESVAVVDQEGVVTAMESGSCQIIALINGVNYVMNVTSEYAPAAAIEIYAESTEISGIGNTLALTVLNTDETPEWISTDINVSTVDENGIVTAVGEGTVLIIAKINDVPYTITITVKSDVLYGDANLSGDINISDAVTILSYVSNSDKYALSEQQIDAADVYMRGDGLNNMDALSVQKFISNNLSALSESYT